jgi:hypothetical protein
MTEPTTWTNVYGAVLGVSPSLPDDPDDDVVSLDVNDGRPQGKRYCMTAEQAQLLANQLTTVAQPHLSSED